MPERIYRYEKYIGYSESQLGSYDEATRSYIPYDEQRQAEIKENLERQFDELERSWVNEGFKSCFSKNSAKKEKLQNLIIAKCGNLINEYLENPNESRENKLGGLEEFIIKRAFNDIDNKYNIEAMFKFYAPNEKCYSVGDIFDGSPKKKIKEVLYKAIKSEDAISLANIRLETGSELSDYAASIKELQEFHSSKGSFYWLFHPINCYRENKAIRSLKDQAIIKANCTSDELEAMINEEIDFREINNSESYEIENFAKTYRSAVEHSTEAISKETNSIAERGKAEFENLKKEAKDLGYRIYGRDGEAIDDEEPHLDDSNLADNEEPNLDNSRVSIEVDDVKNIIHDNNSRISQNQPELKNEKKL